MRVIAGSHGGRQLVAPRGSATRPTSDRVREALFAMLGSLAGQIVLDLFAGSGALGIEALSRGAERATFVERSHSARAALIRNLDALELRARGAIVAADARSWLRAAAEGADNYDLVLLDPPYAQAAQLAEPLSRDLPGVLRRGARVVSESDRRSPLALELPLRLERRYGDTLIRIHETSPP
jgi:16S rRNA (guanine966-N2)-methyltransferase